MARYREANCKLCRREGEKLFLKGSRCHTEKCAVERREYAPGQHGQRMRRKVSNYGLQLREKQKIRRTYGLLEKQVHNYFKKADKRIGVTGFKCWKHVLTMLSTVSVSRLRARPPGSSSGIVTFSSMGESVIFHRSV